MERVPPGSHQTTRREVGARVSTPQFAASGEPIGAVVYFSSASENTARFIANCRLQDDGINVYRIPLQPKDAPLEVREPYIIVVPTYGGGTPGKAVPIQVKRFLNDPDNRSFIRGVVASGNTNFGEAFCAAGYMVAAKCHVPFMYAFELIGTPQDVSKVHAGIVDFFTKAVNSRTTDTADTAIAVPTNTKGGHAHVSK